MTSKQKISSVWPFFSEEIGTPFATCIICSFKVKRGKDGDRKTWSLKPLWTHLRSRHQTEFRNASESRFKIWDKEYIIGIDNVIIYCYYLLCSTTLTQSNMII